ncbi:HEPN domain-containing protein [Candidatus Babeliales bacterium]|nr:HEPN domain-containing protein [Candidatus Babeliales bacterium]
MVYKRESIIKTHDIEFLLKLCSKYDKNFISLFDFAKNLTSYCFQFRYPDDLLIPEKEEVEIAIKQTNKIFKFVQDKIKEIETGQKNIFK